MQLHQSTKEKFYLVGYSTSPAQNRSVVSVFPVAFCVEREYYKQARNMKATHFRDNFLLKTIYEYAVLHLDFVSTYLRNNDNPVHVL